MHFFMFMYSTIFISTLHVSNYRVVHHQAFIVVYCITQLYTIVQMCTAAAGHICTIVYSCVCNTVHDDKRLMMNDSIVRNM